MEKVVVLRSINERAIEQLKEYFNVVVWEEDKPAQRAFIENEIKDAFGLISLLSDKIDRDLIDKAQVLKVIANYAVGIDNIDVAYAFKKGIVVTNTPDVLTNATAEIAWALLFSVARRIKEGIKLMEKRAYKGWSPSLFLGDDVYGATLGVIGAGRIGTRFALMSKGFDMNVFYFSRSRKPVLEKEIGAKKSSLEVIFEKADYISIHLPLNDETKGIISKEFLFSRKNGAYIINTGRGGVLDEMALIEAIKKGYIKGAGLDVFENEPDVREEFLALNNVVVLPHIGSATHKTRSKMAEMCVQSIIDVYNKKVPANIIK